MEAPKKSDMLNTAIDLTVAKLEKLRELKRSMKMEECTHHLVLDSGRKNGYFLIDIINGNKMVADGDATRIRRYIRMRNISYGVILDIELLPPPPVVLPSDYK